MCDTLRARRAGPPARVTQATPPVPMGQDGPVRRRLVYVLAWVVATAVTAGVAWLGIRSVISAAASPRVAPLSAADLREAAPGDPTPTPTPGPPTSPTPEPDRNVADSAVTKPSPTPIETWRPVPDGKGGTAYRRTFRVGGGEVVVLCAKGDVKVESSKPKAGFSVTTNRQSPESVTVTFFGPRMASRVWAQWTQNAPYAEVTEVTGYGT